MIIVSLSGLTGLSSQEGVYSKIVICCKVINETILGGCLEMCTNEISYFYNCAISLKRK